MTTGRGGSGNNKRVTGKGTEGQGPLNLDPHEVAVLKFNQAQLKERSVKSGRGGVGNITTSPENSTYARTIGSGVQCTYLPNIAPYSRIDHYVFHFQP